MKIISSLIGGAVLAATFATSAHATATLQAQYLFDNNLNSNVAGAPDLIATDPSSTSAFVTDTVYGDSRTVYQFNGTSTPSNQGGLTFNDSGALISANSYSLDLVFEFFGRNDAWRRIIDVQNRQSDNGFYVDPSNNLNIYPVSSGGNGFTTGVYHNVALTVNGTTVTGYLDNVASFSITTSLMDISNPDNPGALVNLFLDNVIAGGQGEWSAGNIALANFYDGVLSTDQLATLISNPFSSVVPPATCGVAGTPPCTNSVPEPESFVLVGLGLAGLGFVRHHRKQQAAA